MRSSKEEREKDFKLKVDSERLDPAGLGASHRSLQTQETEIIEPASARHALSSFEMRVIAHVAE